MVQSVCDKVCEEEGTPHTHVTESVSTVHEKNANRHKMTTHTEEKTPQSYVSKAGKVIVEKIKT